MAENFVNQANRIRHQFIEEVDSSAKWDVARKVRQNRLETLNQERQRLIKNGGIVALEGHRPNSVLRYVDGEIKMAQMELDANARHENLFTQGVVRAQEDAQKHFEQHQADYFDYAVHMAHLAGVAIYVGGQVQEVSPERVNELFGYTKRNPYIQDLLLPPAQCLDRPAGTPIY